MPDRLLGFQCVDRLNVLECLRRDGDIVPIHAHRTELLQMLAQQGGIGGSILRCDHQDVDDARRQRRDRTHAVGMDLGSEVFPHSFVLVDLVQLLGDAPRHSPHQLEIGVFRPFLVLAQRDCEAAVFLFEEGESREIFQFLRPRRVVVRHGAVVDDEESALGVLLPPCEKPSCSWRHHAELKYGRLTTAT